MTDVTGVIANKIKKPKIKAVLESNKIIFQLEKPNTFKESRSLFD
tara:strand:+ start:311 stop:445 length:135 start_codon:yes stop_codon:yes gene_type:complete